MQSQFRRIRASGSMPALLCCLFGVGMPWRSDAMEESGSFRTPASPFLLAPEEAAVTIAVQGSRADEVQQELARARTEQPEAVLIAVVTGPIVVGDQPLRLGSRTCVLFGEGAALAVDPGAKPAALVLVDHAEFVSLAGTAPDRAVLDGGGRATQGIAVRGSGRINIDRIAVRNCLGDGIAIQGRGPERVSDATSVTRCQVRNCNGNGVSVRDAAQFVCVDNELIRNRGAGLSSDSLSTIVSGTRAAWNGTGLVLRSTRAAVARNDVLNNDVGILLAQDAQANLIAENRVEGNGVGVEVAGSGNYIYANRMDNRRELAITGTDNVIASHRRVTVEESGAAGNTCFNPPTLSNDHKEPIIVAGLGRYDIDIAGSAGRCFRPEASDRPIVDLSIAQTALDKARAEHPNDVIVAHLKGLFICTDPHGLTLPDNTCLVLSGAIQARFDPTRLAALSRDELKTNVQLIRLSGKGVLSVSGGTLDGNDQPHHVITAPGGNTAVIDGVVVKRAVVNNITTKHHRAGPIFIRGCTVVDSGNRGIWAHVSRRIFMVDNVCSGNVSDGIDIDAYCMESAALFNVCTGNYRHGVFVEEAVKDNIVAFNRLNGNWGNGVHVWNEAVKGNTGRNVIVGNECVGNNVGVSVGGRSDVKTSNSNFFFNNVCRENRRGGAVYGNKHSAGNYFSQHVLIDNPEPILNWTGQPMALYFASPVPSPTDPNRGVAATPIPSTGTPPPKRR